MTLPAKALMLCAMLLLAGCQTTAPPVGKCPGFAPIRPTINDVPTMSIELARQILAHNEFGAKACGWRR